MKKLPAKVRTGIRPGVMKYNSVIYPGHISSLTDLDLADDQRLKLLL